MSGHISRPPPVFPRIGGKLLALLAVLILIQSSGPQYPTGSPRSIVPSDPALTIPAADWPQLQRDPPGIGHIYC